MLGVSGFGYETTGAELPASPALVATDVPDVDQPLRPVLSVHDGCHSVGSFFGKFWRLLWSGAIVI